MHRYQEELENVKRVLRKHPEGLTVGQVAELIGINRNSVAKYLDVLLISGQALQRVVGPAKLFTLGKRVTMETLADFTHEAIIVLNTEGVVVQANDPARALVGNLQGMPLQGDAPLIAELRQLTERFPERQQRRTIAAGDGWYDVRLVPSVFEAGEQALTLIIDDITVQRATQERLRLLERAVESSSSGITIADMTREDQPLIYVNPAFERMTGYVREEILGSNCRFLQADDRDQEAIATIREALKKGEECTVELRNYRKDGTQFWNELHLAPVKDDGGRVTHYVGVQTETSHRHA